MGNSRSARVLLEVLWCFALQYQHKYFGCKGGLRCTACDQAACRLVCRMSGRVPVQPLAHLRVRTFESPTKSTFDVCNTQHLVLTQFKNTKSAIPTVRASSCSHSPSSMSAQESIQARVHSLPDLLFEFQLTPRNEAFHFCRTSTRAQGAQTSLLKKV